MAIFSKRHYEVIARLIRNYTPPANIIVNQKQADDMLEDIALMFESVLNDDNDRFDRKRFHKACSL